MYAEIYSCISDYYAILPNGQGSNSVSCIRGNLVISPFLLPRLKNVCVHSVSIVSVAVDASTKIRPS